MRRTVLALLAGMIVASQLRGVVAGAARAPAASMTGLWALWSAWGRVALASTGLALLAIGLLDFAFEFRRLRLALAQPRAGGSSRTADPEFR